MTKKIHFPKGEGFKIINNRSQANTLDSIYILPVTAETAEMIVVDTVGRKRTIGITLPLNVALLDRKNASGQVIESGNSYEKTQVDNFIDEINELIVAMQEDVETAVTQAQAATTKNNEQDNRLNNFGNILTNHENRIVALEIPEGGTWSFPNSEGGGGDL